MEGLRFPQENHKTWIYVFSESLPTSGFTPDDKPSYELYLNNPEDHPEKKYIVDTYIPMKAI